MRVGQEPGGKNLLPTSIVRREEARGHPTPPQPLHDTPRHRTATLGDLSFSRRADAATGKKTARHGGKMCNHPSRPPRSRQTTPQPPPPTPPPTTGARLVQMAELGRTLCALKSKNARNHRPRREPPRRSPPGEATTDDPAPAAPTPRRTGPRQARHEQDEAGTEGQAKGMKSLKIASPAKRAKNCESRQFY